MRLPLTIEEITANWLQQALQLRYPDVTVENFEVLQIIWGTSTKVRIALSYNAAGKSYELPPTMIVKGGFELHSSSMQFMYAKEARAYAELLPTLRMRTPLCYFSQSDASSYQSIILMEDLNARGAVFCNPLKGQSVVQVKRRLKVMAAYHAQMWNSPLFFEGKALAWIEPRMGGDTLMYADRYLQPAVWQQYMASPRGAAISNRFHDLNWMRGAFQKLAELHSEHPSTLNHGDTHLGNLYEEADGTPGFFDMQVNRAPWFADVTYHIICALDMVDRRTAEHDLLRYYLGCLTELGITAPSFELALECYSKEIAWGLFVFIINETRFQSEAINTAYAVRFADAALCHNTLALLG